MKLSKLLISYLHKTKKKQVNANDFAIAIVKTNKCEETASQFKLNRYLLLNKKINYLFDGDSLHIASICFCKLQAFT